ncbi:MAG: formate dehydrogenase accessory sulfurtransferase FdhD [Eggerthellaceae bacterium]|jgi:FdhD protein|nr:formate dehydrogenase accessory sulfurtransferase FdhD [Eggerthellaceae bacterium]MDR2715896.1 formate dehydrogenase accessory sulfurtransferase FdhD [Coriobacteriaceae bacterium]
MNIVDAFCSPEVYVPQGIDLHEPGKQGRQSFVNIPVEAMLHVHVNETPFMDIACSPSDLPELVLGRLFSEGMISARSDVAGMRFERRSMRMSVSLGNPPDMSGPRRIKAVSTCESDKPAAPGLACCGDRLGKVRPIPWSAEAVFRLARVFSHDTPGHSATYGLHSCYLAVGEEVLFCCEDLGRHNALDKVIGHALNRGTDLGQALVFTSGRTPVDMVSKVIRAHIPILVTKAVPTCQSVALAQSHRLTLICSAYPDSIKVFSGTEAHNQDDCRIAV